jgi:membrane protein
VLPGILATLALWLISGEIFGRYLADFAYGYVTMYAGLASVMIALIFLYISASIFIFGGELNSVIGKVSGRATRPAPSKRPRKAAASR